MRLEGKEYVMRRRRRGALQVQRVATAGARRLRFVDRLGAHGFRVRTTVHERRALH